MNEQLDITPKQSSWTIDHERGIVHAESNQEREARLLAENARLREALWALNDWLAETGYGAHLPEKLRRQSGEVLAAADEGEK